MPGLQLVFRSLLSPLRAASWGWGTSMGEVTLWTVPSSREDLVCVYMCVYVCACAYVRTYARVFCVHASAQLKNIHVHVL